MASGKRSIGHTVLTGLVQLVGPSIFRLLYSLNRITVLNAAAARSTILAGRPAILAVWHQTMSFAGYWFGRGPYAVLSSKSRDGDFGSRFVRGLGMITVRGSSSSGAREALRLMSDQADKGRSISFMLDGPRGPARVAKPGAVAVARRTGLPILPLAVHIAPAWHLKSWDRHAIPRPGGRVWAKFGDLIRVPRETPGRDLEKFNADLGAELCRLEEELRAIDRASRGP